MAHPLSLSYLTTSDATPLEAIDVAARAGYAGLGFRMLPGSPEDTPPPLLSDPSLLAATARALRDAGIRATDIEIVRLNAQTRAETYTPFLEAARTLGARHVVVAGDDENQARLAENFAAVAELAHQHDLTADLEFMPWTAVPDLATARKIVEASGVTSAGILVDSLHVAYSGGTAADIAALPRHLMNYAQICDGPAQRPDSTAELIALAREGRDNPGEGALDLVAHVAAWPEDMTISVEVPRKALVGRVSPYDRARLAIEAAQRVIGAAGHTWRAEFL